MPTVNATAMTQHLKEISVQVARGARAVVECDGAPWHQRGGPLRVPDKITLRATREIGQHHALCCVDAADAHRKRFDDHFERVRRDLGWRRDGLVHGASGRGRVTGSPREPMPDARHVAGHKQRSGPGRR